VEVEVAHRLRQLLQAPASEKNIAEGVYKINGNYNAACGGISRIISP
jgi:hypothetical protein